MAAAGRLQIKEGNRGGSIDTEPRMKRVVEIRVVLWWTRLSLARTRDRDRDHA